MAIAEKFLKSFPNWSFSLNDLSVVDKNGVRYTEKWLWVNGYEGLYQISNFGRLKSFSVSHYKKHGGRPIIIVPNILRIDGYLSYKLTKKSTIKIITAHRLVAMHFIKNPENKPQINHKDFNVANNFVLNLEWVTQSENQKHSFINGRKSNMGEKNPKAILKEQDVIDIRLGKYSELSDNEIGKIYGCLGAAIWKIKNQRTWRHI